jgi:sulfopyruvate decarboxylase TPP-binding subunit
MIFTGEEIVAELSGLGITHAIWIPDACIGTWESAFSASSDVQLIRICREGEAWPLAAGLTLGGKVPVVIMQTTGLFESGDALRNILFDLRIPIVSIIGARNWLNTESRDTARKFAEPVLQAWGIQYQLIATEHDKPRLTEFLRNCLDAGHAGAILLAE